LSNAKVKTPRHTDADNYLALVRRYPLRPIRDENALDSAIAVIDALLDRGRLAPAEEDYLDVLGDLVERYEDEHHAIETDKLTDGDILRFLIDQRDVTQADVSRATGIAESRISEVLSGKRQLTRAQLILLAAYFHVSPAVFLPA
jgi:HTH-type transcriptional regulator / antitoxin HigA